MRFELPWGRESAAITVADAKLAGRYQGPTGEPLADPRSELRRQLEDPIGAPALRRALTDEDHPTVVVDAALGSSGRTLLEGLLDTFAAAGVARERVTILVHGQQRERARFAEGLAALGAAVAVHDPKESGAQGYLATTKQGHRVYLHRAVLDADVLVTVGRAGFDEVIGYFGTAGQLYPGAADDETQRRCRQQAIEAGHQLDALRARQECDEVGWLAGLFYGVLASLDRRGAIDRIWAGEFHQVQREADQYVRRRWTCDRAEGPVDLIVAGVTNEGGDWRGLAAALDAAASVAGPDAAIAVVAGLEDPPGSAVRGLCALDSFWSAMAALRQSKEADNVDAALLARAIQDRKVYLLSKQPADVVESLAMVPLEDPRELENLIGRARHCFVLEDADRVHGPR